MDRPLLRDARYVSRDQTRDLRTSAATNVAAVAAAYAADAPSLILFVGAVCVGGFFVVNLFLAVVFEVCSSLQLAALILSTLQPPE